MSYTLPITGMNAKKLETIQRKARRASLGKMGFNQNFLRAVFMVPQQWLGALNLVDLTIEQGIRAMDSYLFHQYAQDQISKLMDISLRNHPA